jgi:protein involved in polysaccharide export with SLBB domain
MRVMRLESRRALTAALFIVLLEAAIGCERPLPPSPGQAALGQPGTTLPATAAAAASQPAEPPDYVLQPGDTLSVKFYYNPDLNEQLPIRPDGKISLQLVGEVKAAGQQPAALRQELLRRYSEVLKRPQVEVIVIGFGAQRAYVGGEVGNPQVVPLRAGMTAMQAIIEAGGFRNTAEPRTVAILRDQGAERPLFLVVDLRRNVRRGIVGQDVRLQPKDIVFVPKSAIAEVDQFVSQYIDQVIPVSRSFNVSYLLGPGR